MRNVFRTKVTLLSALAAFLIGPSVFQAWGAPVTLKQVQVSNGNQVDLLFDAKVNGSQLKTEFFNDIVQISMADTNVYPAKISTINSNQLLKVFAYQYAPKLVRCRFTVRGNAEDFKNRIEVQAKGKLVTVRFNAAAAGVEESTDAMAVSAAAPVRSAQPAQINAQIDAEERALLDKVMNGPKMVAAKAEPAKAEKDSAKDKAIQLPAEKRLGGAKPLPNFYGVMMKLVIVLGAFGVAAFLLKKIMGNRTDRDAGGMLGSIGRFAKKGIGGLRAKERMIEVLSTHHLGPKKSIAVVRVVGRVLVLGVSNDAINLITQLSGDSSEIDLDELGITTQTPEPRSAGTGATAAGPAVFSELLNSERSKPSFESPRKSQSGNVRAQIRSRLEGLKPL